MTAESDLKRYVVEYANALPGCYARVIQVKGIRGRRSLTTGVWDIIGVYYGHAFAIETKIPPNYLTNEQKLFGERWRICGGSTCVAKSLNDAVDFFNRIKDDNNHRSSIRGFETAPDEKNF